MQYFERIKLLLKHKIFSVIANLSASVELVIVQVDDHVKMRLISQLSNSISRILQKSLKYFNGTIISTSFVLLLALAFSVIFYRFR